MLVLPFRDHTHVRLVSNDTPEWARSAYSEHVMIARRGAWVLTGILAIPGLLVGIVTGYAFVIAPLVFVSGVVVGRSTRGVGFSLGVFFGIIIALAVGLGLEWDNHDWWFFAVYGASILLALLATFKLGTEARVRGHGLVALVLRVQPAMRWSGAALAAVLLAAALVWAATH